MSHMFPKFCEIKFSGMLFTIDLYRLLSIGENRKNGYLSIL